MLAQAEERSIGLHGFLDQLLSIDALPATSTRPQGSTKLLGL
jgi:hypothetical protein